MDDRSDDTLLQALRDPDERVRSAAAVELARREHPDALEACLATIDDAAESTHAESTPSVWCLVAMGARAIDPLLERMATAPAATRQRAAHALMHITRRRFGFDGTRWPDGAYAGWAAWWTATGYDDRADEASRERAVATLRDALRG